MSLRSFFPQYSAWVSASPSTGAAASGLQQLIRVQNFSINDTITRSPVLQLGQTDTLDLLILEAPTVNLDLTYLMNGVRNESGLGFNVNGTTSALTNLANGSQLDKNYYFAVSSEGTDAIGDASNNRTVIGVGNSFLGQYAIQGAVGQFPTATITVNGIEQQFVANLSSGIDPAAVNPTNGAPITNHTVTIPVAQSGNGVTAIRPDGLSITLSNNPYGISSFCAQSFNLSLPLNLTPNQCLGDRFPSSRLITFPIPVTVSIEANMKDFASARLSNFICQDTPTDILIEMKQPGCTGAAPGATLAGFRLTNAKFQNRTFNVDVNNQFGTISLQFESQIGASSGPGKASLLMSGSINN